LLPYGYRLHLLLKPVARYDCARAQLGGGAVADLFVSYKSEDRDRVAPLVAALEADGVGLWWDAHIGGGTAWRDTIETELNAARCVLVVWSTRSTGPEGSFVRDEATRALRRGAYLPVRIDPVEPPLGFGETQALSLIGWKGNRENPGYAAVRAAVQAVIAGKPHVAPATAYRPKRGIDRRLVLGGSAAVVVAAGTGGWLWLRPAPAAAGDSIAVLPFANLSGDSGQAYFSDGIAEELRSSLARIAELKVAARTSSEMFRDAADVKKAARALGVANILIGSVRRSPSTIRVAAQLVDGDSGLERWAQTFDRPAGDALAVQTDIAETVAGALRIRFGRAERAALALGGTSVAAAQDELLRSRAIAGSNLPDQRRKLALIDSAITLDPKFATAYASRAAVFHNISNMTGGTEGAAAIAAEQEAAARAVALAPDLAFAQSALGLARSNVLDFKGADVAYRRALALGGGDPRALGNVANFFSNMGRGAEALSIMDRAIALDPLNPRFVKARVFTLVFARRYAEAIASAERALSTGAGDDLVLSNLGDALVLSGKPREALTQYARVEEEEVRGLGNAIATARLGDRAAADSALATLLKFPQEQLSYNPAAVYAQRGEPDRAIAFLERVVANRDAGVIELPGQPLLDPLRGDPRFKALLARLNFP
jgi:TolB-like protein/tetratricopeptide (TPR) repeat protein